MSDDDLKRRARERMERDGPTNRARLTAKPVIVCHLEDPPGSGLAACCGLPFDTPSASNRYPLVFCTGCMKAAMRP